MSQSNATFQHPHRTWEMRLFNAAGTFLRQCGLRWPITPEGVIKYSQRRTWLKDWGSDRFHEPLTRLVTAYEEEARLSPHGRLLTWESCINFATNRLILQDCVNRYPAILNEEIRKPLFVIGLPRTGTTLLYNLLAQDPGARPLMCWEALWPRVDPVRVDGKKKDRRRLRMSVVSGLLNRIVPDLQTIHPIEPNGPEECTWLISNTFASMSFSLDGRIPSYLEWYFHRDHQEFLADYEDYRRQLQILQFGEEPGRRWILKSPAHLPAMKAILDVFPDAGVVQTHRDPHQVVGSACSLFAVSRGVRSNHVDPHEVGQEVAEFLPNALRKAMDARQSDSDRIVDVQYRDLVADPLGTVHKIYDHYQLTVSPEMEAGMLKWIEDNPRNKRGVHRYSLEDFGLTPERVSEVFAEYCERFDVAAETARA